MYPGNPIWPGQQPAGPRWQVPEECPNCGAAIEQAVASRQDNPHCEYCREPIPVQPVPVQPGAGQLGAGGQPGFPGQGFPGQQGYSGQGFPGQQGGPGQAWNPNGGWSGPAGYQYPWSRGTAGRYGRRRARVAVLPVIIAGVVATIAISSFASKLTHRTGPGVVTPSLAGTAPAAAGITPTAQLSLVTPPPSVAGGLFRDRSAENAAFRSQAAAARRDMVLATSAAAAAYQQPHRLDRRTGKPALIDYFGFGLSTPGTADANLIPAYRVAIAPAYTATTTQSVPAGPGGGAASCSAGATFGGSQVTICLWVAEGTVGALEAPARDDSIGQLAALMRQMRPALERG